jgi:hypothetical protein
VQDAGRDLRHAGHARHLDETRLGLGQLDQRHDQPISTAMTKLAQYTSVST